MEKEKDEMTMNPQNKTEKEENTLSDVQSAAIADEKQGELEKDTEQSVAFAWDKENLVEKRAEIEKTVCAPCEENVSVKLEIHKRKEAEKQAENTSDNLDEKQSEQVENGEKQTEKQGEKTVDSSKKLSGFFHKRSDEKESDVHIQKDLMAQKSMAKSIGMNTLSKLKESLFSVLPVAVIVLIFALTPITDFTTKEIVTFVVSAIMLVLGIALFNVGADLAMTPMGEQVGAGLTKSKKLPLLLGVGFAMGVLITVAEPDLSVLAEQVKAVMNNTVLVVTVGVGVGLFLVVAISKIVFRKDLSSLLLFFYMVLFALTAIMFEKGKGVFLPMAFDSGGVTTGPITVPFIMALGVGVALNSGGRNAKENSFGLIALCSIGPMLAVMALSLASKGDMSFTLPDYSIDANLGANFAPALGAVALEVLIALGLIVVFFAILQVTVLKLPKQKLLQIGIGILYTYVGLVVFLTSVKVGFMPIGFKLGAEIANFSKPLLIVFAFVIGFVVVLAEPAVHVLNKQVEQITNGAVSKRSMLVALSIGVGLSIGLSVIRIIYGFSLLYYLIPGYLISLGLSFFVPKIYTAIAFDSGGVASGPLTSSFILPFAVGACAVLCGEQEVLSLAFGIVAMVAMTPLITIQLLGFRAVASAKVKDKIVMRRILDADDEQIINFM